MTCDNDIDDTHVERVQRAPQILEFGVCCFKRSLDPWFPIFFIVWPITNLTALSCTGIKDYIHFNNFA